MAQKMSLEEMVEQIEDNGGWFEFTMHKPKRGDTVQFEVMTRDTGGAEVGQKYLHLSPREEMTIRDNIYLNRAFRLGSLSFDAVRIISERSLAFREFAKRELEP